VLTPAGTRAVKRADIVALHARLFDPSRLLVTVAGGAEVEDVIAALDNAFEVGGSPAKPGSTPKAAPAKGAAPGKPAAGPPALPQSPSGPRLVVVDKPGTTIATIAMGAVGPAYGSADVGAAWLALDLLADGSFGRLTTRLRDQLGDVPRVSSRYAWMRLGGLVAWQARAPTDRVGSVVLEADRTLRDLAAQGPGEDDLADVKGRRTFAYVTWFETTAGTAGELALSTLYQQPDDALVKFPDRFAAVSIGNAKAAAARYLDPDRVRTVIVGDWAKLGPSLATLGWGPVELRTADAAVAPRP
jgi:predicted Zn-dependent peptidase